MKTAEEWLIAVSRDCTNMPAFIKSIQLDAWKQGMTDAAEIVITRCPCQAIDKDLTKDDIVSARDNKTSL